MDGPTRRFRFNPKAAIKALRDSWADSEKLLITNAPPAAPPHPPAAVPPAAPHLTTPDLPTAGEWVRGLLAKGFVPVKVEVSRRARKARAPAEFPNPPTVDSPKLPGETEPAAIPATASELIAAKGMTPGAWVRSLLAQGLKPAGPIRVIRPPEEKE